MKNSKKKGSRVLKSRKACTKIAEDKEQMTLKQLSDAFGSVTMMEAASASTEPNSDSKMDVEIFAKCVAPKLDQSLSSSGNYDVGSISSSSASMVFGDGGQCGYSIDKAPPDVLLEMSASSGEQASGYSESTGREDEHLLESNSDAIGGNKRIGNLMTIDMRGLFVKQAMKLLKLHLLFGAVMRTVRSFRVITGCGSLGAGELMLKNSIINLLLKEGIQFSEENRGTMLKIRLNGQTSFSFLSSDSDSDSDNEMTS